MNKYSLGLLCFGVLISTHSIAQVDIYSCTDSHGKTEYRTTGIVSGCQKLLFPTAALDNATGSKPLPKSGAEWKVLFSSDKLSQLVNARSIAKSGTYRKAWISYNQSQPRQLEGEFPAKYYSSLMSLQYFNCDERTTSTAQLVYYSEMYGSGEVVKQFNNRLNASNFVDVVPGSFDEGALDFVCARPLPKR
jgi:surface-adhesin protein E